MEFFPENRKVNQDFPKFRKAAAQHSLFPAISRRDRLGKQSRYGFTMAPHGGRFIGLIMEFPRISFVASAIPIT
jgi:hypothetical protein